MIPKFEENIKGLTTVIKFLYDFTSRRLRRKEIPDAVA